MIIKPAIQAPLTAKEVKELVNFLSYHLGYAPNKVPNVIFCKTAKQFARLFADYKSKEPDRIDEINRNVGSFFDHTNDTVVFKGFSYLDGIEVPEFIIPMNTVIHELIHFFQIATGTYGTSRVMYEGTNEILSAFFTDDLRFDYKKEVLCAFNLIMELNDHNFWAALQWMRTYTLHSHKNRFVYREIKQCSTLSRYSPSKLLKILDAPIPEDTVAYSDAKAVVDALNKIDNDETRKILTRYTLPKIKTILKLNREVIKL